MKTEEVVEEKSNEKMGESDCHRGVVTRTCVAGREVNVFSRHLIYFPYHLTWSCHALPAVRPFYETGDGRTLVL